MIKIVPVDSPKRLHQFIMLPFELYKDDPNWVAPLISEQKKFFNPSLKSIVCLEEFWAVGVLWLKFQV
jgi:hypothetical protein